jgi:hypothetical protein
MQGHFWFPYKPPCGGLSPTDLDVEKPADSKSANNFYLGGLVAELEFFYCFKLLQYL